MAEETSSELREATEEAAVLRGKITDLVNKYYPFDDSIPSSTSFTEEEVLDAIDMGGDEAIEPSFWVLDPIDGTSVRSKTDVVVVEPPLS